MIRCGLVMFVIAGCAEPSGEGPGPAPDDPPVFGGPGCGFERAAFCDTFDAPSTMRGRAGDLDARRWSASHGQPAPALGDDYIGIRTAPVPACRDGLPARVAPGDDAIVCPPNAGIASSHLLVATAAQNYGQSSLRIRQPFDFEGRTGRIVFDAEAVAEGLLGWISVEITRDPDPAPSFAVFVNDEGGAVPHTAVEIQLQRRCFDGGTAVRMIEVIEGLRETRLEPENAPCIATSPGRLNHFEVAISESRIEIYGTPFSADGTTFAEAVLLYGVDVDLPFSRGYVHITTHNHATMKYGVPADSVEAWLARWDNVGFDGPIVDGWREYEVLDSLVSTSRGTNAVAIAYLAAEIGQPPADVLKLHDVDLAGISRARISLSAWYLFGWGLPHDGYRLHHRWNGGPWRERAFSTEELERIDNGRMQSQMSHVIDVELSDLRAGTNQLELATSGIPHAYPPVVGSIDLVLD
jgi:hypothetical protein